MMTLDRTLQLLAHNPGADVDLVEVALGLAQDEYPHLDIDRYLAEVDELGDRLSDRLDGSLEDRVTELSHLLFAEEGYQGDNERYYDTDNSYLNRVMDRKRGLPITLSILAMSVGSRAGLQIEGIGLPGHFVAGAVEDGHIVLFDPFNGGSILTIGDCERLAEQATGQPFEATTDDLGPTPAGAIIRRMLTNLKASYLRTSDFPRAARVIRRILQLEPDNAAERRDLGMCLMQSGRHGAAIDHLSVYLANAPVAPDAEAIRRLLRQARYENARWN
jgi:regulator of sirC expression with transglutaminase-like and TPR domain